MASPNPPSDTHDVAAVAEALLLEIPGIEVERVEPAPRVVSLVGRIRGARPGRRLIFNGHLDTFPLREDLPGPCRRWAACSRTASSMAAAFAT